MTRLAKLTILTAVSLSLVLGMSMAQAATLNRLAAQFRHVTVGGEDFTTLLPTVAPAATNTTIYTKTVFVPDDAVLYIRLYATGDTHTGAASELLCLVDGVSCLPGTTSASGISGWVVVQRHLATEDLHDNSVTYGWCKQVPLGFHTVTLKLASSISGDSVFLEGENYTIDFEENAGHCTLGSP